MPTLGAPLDFAGLEAKRFVAHLLTTAPTVPAPVEGQVYFNTTGGNKTLYFYDGTAWVSAKSGAPSGAAGGDLAGTYPNPTLKLDNIANTHINSAAAIAESKLNLASDAAAGTASRRTLGTGALQAAAGNDARFTDSRAPNGAAGGDLAGTYPNPTIGLLKVTDAHVAAANKNGTDLSYSMRQLGTGAGQAMPGTKTLDAIPAAIATIDVNSNRITGVGAPSSGSDATNKTYVDGLVQGLDAKVSVRCATTTDIALSGAPSCDGINPSPNDRVLVKNQTLTQNNGIYVAAAGAWARAADMDAWAEVPGSFVFVETGSTLGETGWVSTADQGGTLNTTPILWTQFSGAGQLVAGSGILKTGNQIDIGAGTGITVNADDIQISATYLGQTSITTLGTITTGTWTGTAIGLANGGTGQTTAKTARETGLSASGHYTSATHGAGSTITITAATHGLRASRGLKVVTIIEATGAEIWADPVVASNGDVTVTFGASQSANTIRTTIFG